MSPHLTPQHVSLRIIKAWSFALDLGALNSALQLSTRDRFLHIVLIVFVILSLGWSLAVPVFEAPDEPDHLQYVLFVADNLRVPNLWTDAHAAGIEALQPPLYYLILGTLVRLTGLPHPFVHPTPNPDFSFLKVDSPINYFLPSDESFPYVYFLRILSISFGMITVACTYIMAALLGADRKIRLATSAAVAFLPQFTFISTSVSNDSLAAMLSAISIVWLTQLIMSDHSTLLEAGIFGLLCGFALVTKLNTIFLMPFGLLILFLVRHLDRRFVSQSFLWALFGFLAVAGWYLLNNQWLYGDLLALQMQSHLIPELVDQKSLFHPYNVILLPLTLYISFIGTFGWMIIYLPAIAYAVYAGFWTLSLFGTARRVIRQRGIRIPELLVLAPGMILILIISTNLSFNRAQGRYLFPALLPISFLFILGLDGLPPLFRRVFVPAAPIFLLLTNVYALWLVGVASAF